MQDHHINSYNLGILNYRDALNLQNQLHESALKNETAHILFLQHFPVITLGKNADPKFLLHSLKKIENEGVEIVHTDRGGQVTGHEPGQLVVYPILPLLKFQLGAKKYVCQLEEVVIRTLADFNISAKRDAINPGVWVGLEKICAIGIRIDKRISRHGLALNVDNSLDIYKWMVPCGISNRGITSIKQQLMRQKQDSPLNVEITIDKIVSNFSAHFEEVFQIKLDSHESPHQWTALKNKNRMLEQASL